MNRAIAICDLVTQAPEPLVEHVTHTHIGISTIITYISAYARMNVAISVYSLLAYLLSFMYIGIEVEK